MSKRTTRSRRFVEPMERRVLLAAQPQFLDDFEDLYNIFDLTFDYTFNGNSLVTTDAELLDDGSLVIGGYDLTFFEPRAFVAKFDKFGNLDPIFNGGDIRYLDISGIATGNFFVDGASKVTDLAVQPDGSIVIVGATGLEGPDALDGKSAVSYPFKARLLPNGQMDTAFGTQIRGYPREVNTGVEIAPDGRIVYSNYGYDQSNFRFYAGVGELLPSGAPNVNFGPFQGVANLVLPNGLGDLQNAKLARAADGSLYVAGSVRDAGNNFIFSVQKFTADGFQPPAHAPFGAGGLARINFLDSPEEFASDLAIQPDGKIVVVGRAFNTYWGDNDFAAARINPDGTLDTTFGGDGFVMFDLGGEDQALAVDIQPDGQICIGGLSNDESVLVALLPDGSYDTGFGDGGYLFAGAPSSLFSVSGASSPSGALAHDGVTTLAALALNQQILLATKRVPDGTAVFGRTTTASNGTGQTEIARVLFDHTAPTAAVSAGAAVTAGGGVVYDITVVYSDNIRIDGATLDGSDILVTGPNGFSASGALLSQTPSNGGKQTTAVYRVAAPGGTFDSSDNGTYTISVVPGQVRDPAGQAVAAASGSFDVSVPGGIVPAIPTATLTAAAPVITSGSTSTSITVTYADDGPLNAGTVDVADLVVTRAGGTTLAVTSVTVTPSAGGNSLAAIYQLAAPGGSFDAGDNGAYTVSIVGGQVFDNAGNAVVAANLGTLAVAVPGVNGNPTAALQSAPALVSIPDATPISFTVLYADDAGINAASINTADVTVSGPAGVLSVTNVSKNGGGKSVTATYTIAPPGGTWDPTDNGVYTIALNASQVQDTTGKFAAATTLGTFTVGIIAAAPPPEPDGALSGALTLTGPAGAIGGTTARIKGKLVVTNQSAGVVEGTITVRLLLSPDATADANDAVLQTVTKFMKFKEGQAKPIKLKAGRLPALPDGTYQYLAVIATPDGVDSDWVHGPSLALAAPFIDLAVSGTPVLSRDAIAPGGALGTALRVRNLGNTPFNGSVTITVTADAVTLHTVAWKAKLKPQAVKPVSFGFLTRNDLASGLYTVTLAVAATGDANGSNNAASIPGLLAVF